MLKHKCLCSLLFLGFYCQSEGATKTWKYTNNILNPLNWEGGALSTDCKGVIFPENLGSVGTIFELYTDELILPTSGELEIRPGGFIQISEFASCIRVKELKHRPWLSPNSWDFGQNSAIPDAEKVPCAMDDVVFPPEDTVSVYYPEVFVSVNSVQVGGLSLNNEQWQNFLESDYGGEQFYTVAYRESGITVAPSKCTSKSGCMCHYADDILYWICQNVEKREEPACFAPVTPIGHCGSMCGGIVLLEISADFSLNDFKRRIPSYENVDSYASKVTKSEKPFVQVVFAEKDDYSESSADAAHDFHNLVSGDPSGFRVITATLERSGIRIPKGSQWGTAFSIILGTLVAVLVVSGCIYTVYVGPLENYRVPFREISLRNLRPLVFSKFENREEGQMSMAASMMSLGKAFDNPMFGSHRSSTSSAVVEAAVDVLEENGRSQSESTHENLIFTEGSKCETVEIEDIGEE